MLRLLHNQFRLRWIPVQKPPCFIQQELACVIAEALEQPRLPESSPGNNVNAAQVKLLRCICGELGQEIDDFSVTSHGVRLGAQPPQLSKNPLKCCKAGNE